MPSSSSRLVSWLRRSTERKGSPVGEKPATPPTSEPSRPATPRTVRLGLDFGTTTTLVAARVDDNSPVLLRLEDGQDAMPSYYWRSPTGEEAIGARAQNLPGPIHSIKLGLAANEPVEGMDGLLPSDVARRIVLEALRRALVQLQRQGLVPPEAERLEVATNVGCSAAWDLRTRTLMRDIAADAGLRVAMANVIEEPIAAALAVILTGAFGGGRLLLVDIGGGTLDTCVLEATPGTNRFRIYASGGRADLGGDRYTDVVAKILEDRLVGRRSPGSRPLTTAEKTRLWMVAEEAKRSLSSLMEVRVQLPGTEGPDGLVTVTREAFERAASGLVLKSMAAVTDTYRIARLVLGRGPQDMPGTPFLNLNPIRKISDLHLDDDGEDHIDHVVLVGGASQMPMIRREFVRIFTARLEDPSVYGLEPLDAVALGLAQHEALEALDFGYPNWAIAVEVTATPGHEPATIDLYSPFAPIFKLRMQGSTTVYAATAPLPAGARALRVVFRRVSPGEGVAWHEVLVPQGSTAVQLRLTLLGDIEVAAATTSGRVDLYPELPVAPWKTGSATHPDWLPTPVRPAVDTVCEHGKGPAMCGFLACRNHVFGGSWDDSN